jgi:hypothetical protein
MIMQVPGIYIPTQAWTRIQETQFHKSLDGTLGLAEDDWPRSRPVKWWTSTRHPSLLCDCCD